MRDTLKITSKLSTHDTLVNSLRKNRIFDQKSKVWSKLIRQKFIGQKFDKKIVFGQNRNLGTKKIESLVKQNRSKV